MKKFDKVDKIFKFVQEYITDNGYPPSIREICSYMNFKSTSTAQYYLDKMKEHGLIIKKDNKNM